MAFCYYTMGTPTSAYKGTVSIWCKVAAIGTQMGLFNCNTNSTNKFQAFFETDGTLTIFQKTSGSVVCNLVTRRLFHDPSAWYHFVIAWDTTQSETDRVKLYVNGVRETQFSTATYPTASLVMMSNISGNSFNLGVVQGDANPFYGNMSHFQFVDGLQLAPTEFAETDSTSGIWKIKTGAYATPGTNGFFLKMEDRTNLDLDSSSNAHTFTTSGNLTATYDNPSNNFATWNPIARWNADTGSLSNGNTTYSLSSYAYNAKSSLAMEGGKWYWEVKQSAINCRVGVTTSGANNNLDTDSTAWILGDQGNGGIWVLNSTASANWQSTNNDTTRSITSYTTAATSGADSIIMVALDVDSGKMYMGVDGTWFNSSDPAAGTNPVMTITNSSPDPLVVIGSFGTSGAMVNKTNFGNGYFGTDAVASANADDAGIGAFEYDVPTGFYALCTKNISLQGG